LWSTSTFTSAIAIPPTLTALFTRGRPIWSTSLSALTHGITCGLALFVVQSAVAVLVELPAQPLA
jgi:hypothetical protein